MGSNSIVTARCLCTEFIAFVSELVNRTRWAKRTRIVLDNVSAHKTKAVEHFLAAHPEARFHYTATYSSRLNQVELWFAEIQRDLLARHVYLGLGFEPKILRYIHAYANVLRPFR